MDKDCPEGAGKGRRAKTRVAVDVAGGGCREGDNCALQLVREDCVKVWSHPGLGGEERGHLVAQLWGLMAPGRTTDSPVAEDAEGGTNRGPAGER